jgi:glutamine synthetase
MFKAYKNKQEILKKAQRNFSNSTSLSIKIGIELEFFLLQKNLQAIDNQEFLRNFISELKVILLEKYPLIYDVEKEQGVSQIEIKTIFTDDLEALARAAESVKDFIKNFALSKNSISSFSAQPFIDDCGNALQFNISIHNKDDLFEDNVLNNSIAALLSKTNEIMLILAPKPDDYLRFSYDINKNLFKKGKYTAPVNLSFGSDNRTCAIRIPALENGKKNKRLEYRIAAADADPFLCLAAIANIIAYGLANDLDPLKSGFTRVYGNAFDEKYSLCNFCKSIEESEQKFNEQWLE